MTNSQALPPGFRQGLITSITVVFTASILYFRFVVFEPSSGPWTKWGAVCAVLAGSSVFALLYTLWRALQPVDEQLSIYTITLRWFAVAILLLVFSLVADTVAVLVY